MGYPISDPIFVQKYWLNGFCWNTPSFFCMPGRQYHPINYLNVPNNNTAIKWSSIQPWRLASAYSCLSQFVNKLATNVISSLFFCILIVMSLLSIVGFVSFCMYCYLCLCALPSLVHMSYHITNGIAAFPHVVTINHIHSSIIDLVVSSVICRSCIISHSLKCIVRIPISYRIYPFPQEVTIYIYGSTIISDIIHHTVPSSLCNIVHHMVLLTIGDILHNTVPSSCSDIVHYMAMHSHSDIIHYMVPAIWCCQCDATFYHCKATPSYLFMDPSLQNLICRHSPNHSNGCNNS